VREVVASGTTTKSVGCKVLFRSGRQHNLYDTKNESFLCRLLHTDTKNCNLVSAAYVSRHEISNFRNKKKTPKPRSWSGGPRFGPCSPLSVKPSGREEKKHRWYTIGKVEVSTSRRKKLRPSLRSRPEVERAAERRHLLVEVDRAATPPERRRLLSRG
jgi:hypothetical protein